MIPWKDDCVFFVNERSDCFHKSFRIRFFVDIIVDINTTTVLGLRFTVKYVPLSCLFMRVLFLFMVMVTTRHPRNFFGAKLYLDCR